MSDDAASTDATPAPEDATAPPPTAFDPDPADAPADPPAPPADVPAASGDGDGDGGSEGGFGTPIATDFPTAPTKGGITGAVVALGSGLLGAAVLESATRARWGDQLDTSTYAVGLAATAGLLGLSLLAAIIVRRKAGGQARGDLVTWPGVVGILATAPMIHVGVGPDHDGKWMAYVIGGVIAGLAALGYVLARRPAFVVTTIVGLGVLYARVFDDTIGHSLKQNDAVVVAVGVTAFVVIITLLGWFLPSRSISGVSVGVVGVVGIVGPTLVLLAERVVAGLLGGSGFSALLGGMGGSSPVGSFLGASQNPADYTDEVSWLFVLTAILTVLWLLAALAVDHSGFKVLAITLPALEVPAGTALISVQHPSWWGAVLGAIGGVLLLVGLLVARGKARKVVGL